ncbi:MAG: energy-coupling factor ABC transporter ATP-binding protein [Rhodospirillales bacterium]|nr:energy-coupling factor ABC transporter ATP-binding protein [Rhodospirillales bacterium]
MSEPLIRLSRIVFAYDSGRAVLDGADLAIGAGDRLALTGGNGAGKSTLLHIIVGLIRPSSGEVIAFGRRRQRERDFWEVRERCGLVFQDPDDQLFAPTVLEDVAFGPRNLGFSRAAAEERARATLAALGIGELASRVGYHLSGGEKRLVALATVLAMQPQVLLLDEPTAGLDETATARVLTALTALPQAMLFVSHDPLVRAALAGRQLRLERGRIAAA